jgi:nitroreductase
MTEINASPPRTAQDTAGIRKKDIFTMELIEAIYGRRATRHFTKEPVTKSMIETLIDAAIQAPSAVNEQPWHFTVVQDPALLDRISDAAKTHMLKVMETSDYPHHFHGPLHEPGFQVFYHAPALIVISTLTNDWGIENASLAAQNLMLSAHAHGLGTCWIGFSQRWLETEEGKTCLDLPPGYTPVAPIIVGHPSQAMPPVPRNPPRLHWIG